MADADKTEKATPERRRKAREDGQFARARDAGGIAAGIGVLLAIVAFGGSAVDEVRVFSLQCFTHPFDLLRGDPAAVIQRTSSTLAVVALPPALAAAIAAMAIGFAEAGFHPRLDLVMPKWERIDPFGKIAHMFSPMNAVPEVGLALARVTVVGWVAWLTVSDSFPTFVRMSRAGIQAASGELLDAVSRLTIRATMVLALLAALDYAQSWFRLEKQLMMSKQEIKDEFKSQEGDVRAKARMRQRARERIKRSISKAVRGADVVLANPTHVSAVLRYRPEEGAPVLVAKGYDEIALHIREVAKEAGIPIVASPPLARAIAARVKVGRAVPGDLYSAVAQVLAFVYRLKGRVPWAA